MRTLTAPPLVLEPLLATHAPEMFVVLSDPALYEFEREAPESEAFLFERYRRLEARISPDGLEHWLNWAVRLPGGDLAGYVQATVKSTHEAFIGYEIGSRHWRLGIGSVAVARMLEELQDRYGVRVAVATLKARNMRSLGLLGKLGFVPAVVGRFDLASDEIAMVREAA